MAEKVTIIIAAKNLLTKTLQKAGASIKAFAGRAKAAFRAVSVAALGLGAALVGIGVKALKAYSVQEKAEKSLAAALRANGDAVKENIDARKRAAAAIQNETAVADELTISRMAQLRMLGIEANALDDAAKAMVGLTHAGMGEDTAARALAAAYAGNFSMLTRYIPALREATTEAEKAAIVNDFVTKNYAAQKDELDTVAGRWAELKGRIGDAWEEAGKVIAGSAGVQAALKGIADWVKRTAERFAAWADDGGIDRLVFGIKSFGIEFQHNLKSVWIYAQGWAHAVFDILSWPVRQTVAYWKSQFKVIKGVLTLNKEEIKKGLQDTFTLEELGATDAFTSMYDDLAKEQEDYNDRSRKLWQDNTKTAKKEAEKQVDEVLKIAGAAQKAAASMNDPANEAAERAGNKAAADAAKERLDDLRKQLAVEQAIAAGGVAGLEEKAKKDKEIADQRKKESDDLRRLREKEARGVKLGRAALARKEMLERVAKAREVVGKGALQKQIEQAEKNLKSLQTIADRQQTANKSLANIENQQAQLLAMG